MSQPKDLRDDIFATVQHQEFTANITVWDAGVICGMRCARETLESLGAVIRHMTDDGTHMAAGDLVLSFTATPKVIAQAEDTVLGYIAKPSGIATAARRTVDLAQGRLKIVSGAWKKMPQEFKGLLREAIIAGGAAVRIIDQPFVYLDKNYVRMLGGVGPTLAAVSGLTGMTKAIQLRGEIEDIAAETRAALAGNAQILMVDTGSRADLAIVSQTLRDLGAREKVSIAFAGQVKIADIPDMLELDVDILDVGTQIIDAPLLDLKLDVVCAHRD